MVVAFSSCSAPADVLTSDSVSDPFNNNSDTVTVTFPEGFTAVQIAERLEENNVCSSEDFLTAVKDKSYLEEFGFSVTDPDKRVYVLEGYLFPDTYEFFVGESVDSVIKKFLSNTKSRLNDDIINKARERGLTLDELLIIASIIQGESGGGPEASNVASVLYNRLNLDPPMKLQCDAGITYLKRYIKPYYDEDTYYEYCLLYNTYNCSGLPVGAINNPGMASINAALNPANTDYLYFVTDSDGIYYYANTIEGHEANKVKAGL